MPYAIISRSTNFSKGLQSYDKFNDRIIGKVDYNVATTNAFGAPDALRTCHFAITIVNSVLAS
jgi:hypothetical protein